MSFSRTAIVLVRAFKRGFAGKYTSALDVADDRAGLVVHELDTALSDSTTRSCDLH